MASPTTTSDPVTASRRHLSPTLSSASDRPDKPIMGNIVSLGMIGPLGLASQLQNAVWDHLVNCGMDTIAYLPDPESSSVMTNVVRSHSRYTVASAKTLSSQQILRYDKYDKLNDLAATKFLLSSLHPALMSKIKEKMDDDDSFHVVWLELIKTIQSTSIERFEDLKAAIKARHPSQYAGENLEALAADYRKGRVSSPRQVGATTTSRSRCSKLSFGRWSRAKTSASLFVRRSSGLIRRSSTLDTRKSQAPMLTWSLRIDVQDICRQAEDVPYAI
ncbi:hypothetical protein MHU86_23638 [Fragilaria crotonensis]|nr:hypothetical protein MHU86_23638 [Fragilaria crotonensis]